MSTINPIYINQNYAYNSIPLAFDESLSYIEELSAILKKLNEIITQTNENTYFIEHYQDEYEEIRKEMDQLLIDVNTRFNQIENELESKFNQLTLQVINLINDNYTLLKNYIDNKYDELDYKIDHISIDSIVLRDPTTGLISNIQIVVNNLFNTFNVDALSCTEFEALDLTATGFDAYQITAYEFDTQGKTILV